MSTQIDTKDQMLYQLADFIQNRQFEEAEALLMEAFPRPRIARALHSITQQETGLLTYTFTNYLIQKHGTAFWHRVAACIVAESLDIAQGNRAGLYHVMEAIKLAPDDWHLKEYALGFYDKGCLELAQAQDFAKLVLEYEPYNRLALRIVGTNTEA